MHTWLGVPRSVCMSERAGRVRTGQERRVFLSQCECLNGPAGLELVRNGEHSS
ncbi:hypothetical protein BaRGS_00014958, partial [Batillaria attramentaria]